MQHDLQNVYQVWRNKLLFRLLLLKRIRYRWKSKKVFQGTRIDVNIPYEYAAGKYVSRYLQGLKQGRILASRCTHCGTTLTPCRQVCGNCFKAMMEIVELPGIGSLHSYTQVSFPFIDPFTGQNRPVPYCYGMIQLDGANNTFQGLLNVRYHHHLKTGMRVQVVFKLLRKGCTGDIKYFKILKK